MTREELLRDEWVKENFGDACYPNYLEPNFEAGVEYGERKAIEKAFEWLCANMVDNNYLGANTLRTLNKAEFIQNFKRTMEDSYE